MNCTSQLKKKKIELIVLSIVIAIGLILFFSGLKAFFDGKIYLSFIGVIFIAIGVFFIIRSYISYKDLCEMNKILKNVDQKNEISMKDLAGLCALDLSTTRKYVNMCFKNQLLIGYTRVGEQIISDEFLHKKDIKIISVKCKSCGAVSMCQEGVLSFCDHCGSPLMENKK